MAWARSTLSMGWAQAVAFDICYLDQTCIRNSYYDCCKCIICLLDFQIRATVFQTAGMDGTFQATAGFPDSDFFQN